MPIFEYTAVTPKGRKIVAQVEADSEEGAKTKLVRQNIIALKLTPLAQSKKKAPFSLKELLFFTKELKRLLVAGLPLYEAALALEEKYRGQKSHPFFLEWVDQLKTGRSFSKILSKFPLSFDLFYVSMISNAEKTGSLEASLEAIEKVIERRLKIQRQLISSLTYPILLTLFCGVVLASLLFFVVPSLEELFEGRDLPPFTQLVFSMSRFAIRSKYVLGTLVLFSFASTIFGAFNQKVKREFLSLLMRCPWFKTLFSKFALVRLFRALAAMTEGGVSLLYALSSARKTMGHPILEKFIETVEKRVLEGAPLSLLFSGHPLIPSLIPRMLSIAEESGKLSYTFSQIAEIYEEELEVFLGRFAALIQPILLLFLGLLVGFILLSVLLPLTDVSSLIN